MTPPNLMKPPPPFSVDQFARFWAAPDVALVVPAMFAEDVVGDWPGDPEPVRGFAAYKARIAQLLDAVPDVTLEVADHATNGNLIFIRWIARGTGADGPFELTGSTTPQRWRPRSAVSVRHGGTPTDRSRRGSCVG